MKALFRHILKHGPANDHIIEVNGIKLDFSRDWVERWVGEDEDPPPRHGPLGRLLNGAREMLFGGPRWLDGLVAFSLFVDAAFVCFALWFAVRGP